MNCRPVASSDCARVMAAFPGGVFLAVARVINSVDRQCLNLSLDGGGVDAGMGLVEDCAVLGADPLVSEGTVIGGGRRVVLLDHLRAVSLLGDQFLLRVEEVRQL